MTPGRALALVAFALALLFGGLRAQLRERVPWPGVFAVTRAAVAAAYCALLLHTLVYASFLEDPLSWLLLALAAGLRRTPEPAAEEALSENGGARARRGGIAARA